MSVAVPISPSTHNVYNYKVLVGRMVFVALELVGLDTVERSRIRLRGHEITPRRQSYSRRMEGCRKLEFAVPAP